MVNALVDCLGFLMFLREGCAEIHPLTAGTRPIIELIYPLSPKK